MTDTDPPSELQEQYSSPGAEPIPWDEIVDVLEEAGISWLSTVRTDGRPHVTPLMTVLLDGSLHFCTGGEEVKARNIHANPWCVLTTGCNEMASGIDVVVEGRAARVTDESLLRRLAQRWASKYDWHYTVRDGLFVQDGDGEAPGAGAEVYAVLATKAFSFGRAGSFSSTRYVFASA